MSYKQIVKNALVSGNHKIKEIDTPLHNEFVLDGVWRVEMDRDGAFAAIVSMLNNPMKTYDITHRLVVFCQLNGEADDTINSEICDKIMDAVHSIKLAI